MVTHKEQEIFIGESISLYIYSDRNIFTYCYRRLQKNSCIIFAGFFLFSWAFILTYYVCVSGFTLIFFKFFLILLGFSTMRKDMYKILIYIPLFCRTFQEQQPFCWCSSVKKPHRRNFSSHCRNSFFACYTNKVVEKVNILKIPNLFPGAQITILK